MKIDPRHTLFAVLAVAFADAIPAIERRVGVMRTDPVWGEEELPIILLDLDSERSEIETAAPRVYRKQLQFDVLVYCGGESDAVRLQLFDLVSQAEAVMAEWQDVRVADIDSDAPNGEDSVIDYISLGDAVNYFTSPNGDQEHLAARLACVAEFRVSGSSAGEEKPGIPKRNILAQFREMVTSWRHDGQSVLQTFNSNLGNGDTQ